MCSVCQQRSINIINRKSKDLSSFDSFLITSNCAFIRELIKALQIVINIMRPERRFSPRGLGVSPYDTEVDFNYSKTDKVENRRVALIGAIVVVICVLCVFVLSLQPTAPPRHTPLVKEEELLSVDITETLNIVTNTKSLPEEPATPDSRGCRYNLPEDYFHYKHIVVPPEGPVTLVCCSTTKGPMNIAVHSTWAPLGAARFLEMVETKFFSTRVPLFRALKGFLVQFGLAGTNLNK